MTTREYTLEIDPLHRNVWPVSRDGHVIGQVVEHVTLDLSGGAPPVVRWSWQLDEAVADRLSVRPAVRRSGADYATHGEALDVLAALHSLALTATELGPEVTS